MHTCLYTDERRGQDPSTFYHTGSKILKTKGQPRGSNSTSMREVKVILWSRPHISLFAVPIGAALDLAGANKVVAFVIPFVAIIPLAAILSYASEELSLHVGKVLGDILNIIFGISVELIVSVVALMQEQPLIVRTYLIGSILSNLLHILDMCFCFGGQRRSKRYLELNVMEIAASLTALAIGSLVIPTTLKMLTNHDSCATKLLRGVAVLPPVTYGCYLFIELSTYVDSHSRVLAESECPSRRNGAAACIAAQAETGETSRAGASASSRRSSVVEKKEDTPNVPRLTKASALTTLASTTILVALCAEYSVSVSNEVANSVPPESIGLLLLLVMPGIVGHVTAVTASAKDKENITISVAVGSGLRAVLLVLPLTMMVS